MENVSIYLISIGLYCVAMLALGVIGNRKSVGNSIEDFFLGSRSIGSVASFFAIAATLFSAFALQGAPNNFFNTGMGAMIFMIVTLFEAFLFFIIASRLNVLGRERGYITLGDLIEDRYQSLFLRRLISVVQIFITIPYIAIQLTAFGNLMLSFSGGQIPFWLGSIILGLVMAVYIVIGGYRSVAWTNVLQGILMLLVLLLGASLLLGKVEGGITGLFIRTIENDPGMLTVPGTAGVWTQSAWFSWLIFMFAMCAQPHIVQKFFSAKSVEAMRPGFVALPIYGILVYGAAAVFGLVGKDLMPETLSGAGDQFSMLLVIEYLPLWVSALMACGIIAAAMSTSDSQYITLASLITRDFMKQVDDRSDEKDIKAFKIGRFSVIILFIIGYIIAVLQLSDIVGLITKGIFPFGSQLFIPMVGAIFWKRSNKYGAITSLIAGLSVVSLFMLTPLNPPLSLNPVIWGVLINLILFVSVSLLTSDKQDKE